MTDDVLKKIAQDVGSIYCGMECRFAEWVLLPFWEFTADMWVKKSGGPKQLDQIFFGLLQNGVNTRKEIALNLGVDEGEFVLSHLDILIREGYVSDDEGVYTVTELGHKFVDGDYFEERQEKMKFRFIWNDISNCIEMNGKMAVSEKNVIKIKHDEIPPESDLIRELSEHFNKDNHDEGIVFYDVDSNEHKPWWYKQKKVYKKYAALFYASLKDDDDYWFDLRIQESSGDKYSLCEELSRLVNKEECLCEQFEKIYTKSTLPKDE